MKEQILAQIYTIHCHYPSDDPIFAVEPEMSSYERRMKAANDPMFAPPTEKFQFCFNNYTGKKFT